MINNRKVIGFICECNPFHKGHNLLIKEAQKKGDVIVAVMSGNFVQRGEPAIYDKYKRTLSLLKNNVDLVIELPVEFVLSSANIFANAGVNILQSLGFVDEIIFGSESNDIEKLKKIANNNIYDKNDKSNIKDILKKGVSYPKAIELVTGEKLLSNDILAVEYIRAILKAKNKLNFSIIKRNKKYSATKERKLLKKKITTNKFTDILNYSLLNNTDLNSISGTNEDFCNSIYKIKTNSGSFDKKSQDLHTKNRTLSSIKRTFLNIILNIKKVLLKKEKNGSNITYIKILGIKKEATMLLKYIKIPYLIGSSNKSFEIFNKNFSFDKITMESIKLNEYASNIYNIVSNNNKVEATEKFIVY